MEVEHSSFDSDVNLLITKLEKMLGVTSQPSDDYETQYEEVPDFEEGVYDNEYPQPPNLPQGLQSILPGAWQVNINMPTPYGIVPMQMNIEIRPNGTFQGVAPTLMVQGQWSILAMQQLMLTGQQSNGMQVASYNVVIQFTQLSPNQLSGYTSGNEATYWNRIA